MLPNLKKIIIKKYKNTEQGGYVVTKGSIQITNALKGAIQRMIEVIADLRPSTIPP